MRIDIRTVWVSLYVQFFVDRAARRGSEAAFSVGVRWRFCPFHYIALRRCRVSAGWDRDEWLVEWGNDEWFRFFTSKRWRGRTIA